MPYPDDSGWALRYVDPHSDTRLLVSMPKDMLFDASMLAKRRDCSIAELIRRALTRELREAALHDSLLNKQLRGRCP